MIFRVASLLILYLGVIVGRTAISVTSDLQTDVQNLANMNYIIASLLILYLRVIVGRTALSVTNDLQTDEQKNQQI